MLRNVLSQWSNQISAQQFHHYLEVLDPMAAQSIDPSNKRRVIRALEVIFQSGRKFSEQRKKGLPKYKSLIIGLHRLRPELYQRIDIRINNMVANGFVEEVKGLLAKGYSPHLPSMSAIGYREMVLFIKGRTTLVESIRLIQRATRNFVRRQANWFKLEDPEIHWFTINSQTESSIELQIIDTINKFLNETLYS
jgi:tRNA dimethylallyltransferase